MNYIILAGGDSSRLGWSKASTKLLGSPLISLVLGVIQKIKRDGEKILVVGSNNRSFLDYCPFLNYGKEKDLEVVEDIFPGAGPLGGIATGLVHSRVQRNFLVACDMPFLNPKLVERMREEPFDYDLLVPVHSKKVEPLHAIYSKGCVTEIRKKIRSGERQIQAVFSSLNTRFFEVNSSFNPERAFLNVNTPEDLARAKKILKKKTVLE